MERPARRRIARDLIILTVVCAALYLPGLTHRGVVNWQEGIRLLASQEMHARDAWAVPTIHGEPYLAKPPLIYWATRACSVFTGGEVSLATLRLVVAIAAWLGVLLTYLAALALLASPDTDEPTRTQCSSESGAALWAGLMLATGVLYTRSARIGELDILLVPAVTLSLFGLWRAYRSHVDRARTDWPGVALAILGGCAAVLTKGPPGLVVIAVGGYGGISLHQLLSTDLRPPTASCEPVHKRAIRRVTGLVLALSRTHPVAVVGLALLSLWLWGRALGAKIGTEAVQAAAGKEAGDNLVFFQLRPWTRSLEAMSYGVGLASLVGGIGFLWMVLKRPRLPRGAWVLLGWCSLSWMAFSLFSSGTGRYLTPLWPGIAIFAGFVAVRWIGHGPRQHLKTASLAVVIGALGIGQLWWYGFAPAERSAPRSPTRLMAELISLPGTDRTKIASLDFWHAGLSAEAGAPVVPVTDPSIEDSDYFVDFPGRGVMLNEFAETVLDAGETWTVLTVEGNVWDGRPAKQRLEELGFSVDRIPTVSLYEHKADGKRTSILAFKVEADWEWYSTPVEEPLKVTN